MFCVVFISAKDGFPGGAIVLLVIIGVLALGVLVAFVMSKTKKCRKRELL